MTKDGQKIMACNFELPASFPFEFTCRKTDTDYHKSSPQIRKILKEFFFIIFITNALAEDFLRMEISSLPIVVCCRS